MKDLLAQLRAPGEEAAQERAWGTVRAAYLQREPAPRRRSRWRFAPVPAVAAVATAVALSPAGAAVHRWIDHTLGVRHAHPGVFSLPAPGRLLVSGATGAWTVSADGVKRRIGPWPQASWSPSGLYVLLAGRDQLVAADPHGVQHWSISRPAIRFPRWYGPDGYRVAYLSGRALRVIAGDGTGDHELAGNVSAIAPAWRWGHRYELAYVDARGRVVVREADSGLVLWSRRVADPRLLSWAGDGTRLLVVTTRGALVLDAAGRRLTRFTTPARVLDAALSPDGASLAVLSGSEVTLTSVPPRAQRPRRLDLGSEGLRQMTFSPDGHWLLVTLPSANQWVFIRTSGRLAITADSRIAEQFGGRPPSFPHLDGWCCTASGGSG